MRLLGKRELEALELVEDDAYTRCPDSHVWLMGTARPGAWKKAQKLGCCHGSDYQILTCTKSPSSLLTCSWAPLPGFLIQ